MLTRRETKLVTWGAGIVFAGLALGFWMPAFSPPESSRGRRYAWYEAGNRSHLLGQLALGCIPFVIGIAAVTALRRYAAKRDESGRKAE